MFDIKDYSLLEVLEALVDNDIPIVASGSYTDKAGVSHSLTVFDNYYFKRNCLVSFRSWRVTLWDKPEIAFPDLFSSWWNSRKDLYLKQAYAYTLKYNPIENYSSTETLTNDVTEVEHGETIEHEHGLEIETTPANYSDETTYPTSRKTETTPFNTTETTTPTDATTTHSTKGFNSTNFVEVDKEVKSGYETKTTTHPNSSGGQSKEVVEETVTGKEKTERTYSSHETVENSGTDTDTHSGTDTTTRNYTLTKNGNIGIQTASQMLEYEFSGLKQDLAKRALYEFISRYCFLSEPLDI